MSRLAVSSLRQAQCTTHSAILGIGAASPPPVRQEVITELAAEMACQTPRQRQWLQRVFLHSGIETRGSVLVGNQATDVDSLRAFYPIPTSPEDRGPTTADRMACYARHAPILAHAAAAKAMDHAQSAPDAITHLITVSCTGFDAPGLDVSLIGQLGLSPSVRRLHVGFMGCHAAFNALAAARDAVLADPRATVLVCCVELCSLHWAYGWDPGKLVANALFADGAAAVVIGNPPEGRTSAWRLEGASSLLLPDSLEAMTWRIGNHGFEMTLLPSVPDLVRQHLRPWCESWLAGHDLRISDIASWAIHPGGPKILTAVAEALGLENSALQYSRQILARHGNMSSATVLFILQRMAEQAAPGPCVAIGLGPGLMAEAMLLA